MRNFFCGERGRKVAESFSGVAKLFLESASSTFICFSLTNIRSLYQCLSEALGELHCFLDKTQKIFKIISDYNLIIITISYRSTSAEDVWYPITQCIQVNPVFNIKATKIKSFCLRHFLLFYCYSLRGITSNCVNAIWNGHRSHCNHCLAFISFLGSW